MVLDQLAPVYPQLYLPPGKGMSQSDEYKEIVRHGGRPARNSLDGLFFGTEEDRLWTEKTPAGDARVIYFANRSDFENFYRVMGCRCEPVTVSPSMGAVTIDGIVNWRKIEAHREKYEKGGGKAWALEFKCFTSDKMNYTDTLIAVTDGYYSALPPERTPYSPEDWRRKSLTLRINHELTHFVCRRLWPLEKHVVWDEIFADCMGLVAAAGAYDETLAAAFLGVGETGYLPGGRLENYKTGVQSMDELAVRTKAVIKSLKKTVDMMQAQGLSGFGLLKLMHERSHEFIKMLETE